MQLRIEYFNQIKKTNVIIRLRILTIFVGQTFFVMLIFHRYDFFVGRFPSSVFTNNLSNHFLYLTLADELLRSVMMSNNNIPGEKYI